MPERDEDIEAIDEAIAGLQSHFEHITVFATRYDPETGNTISAWRGVGSWHARHGQVREWLIKQDAIARIEARRESDE